VHAKLLEIYAKRKDMRAFEQTALKVKNLTNGSGPEWDKAAALGKSIDPSNGLYAGAAAAGAYVAQAAAEAPPAPALDFDVGSATQPVSLPDLALDVPKPEDTGIDFDVSSAPAKADTGLDFNLDDKPAPPAPDLTLDLNLDAGSPSKAEAGAAPDLSTISLDLGAPEPSAPPAGSDPKWQEIATKLDLAKAYEEMGDKDGARELLGEVIKDGDSAQKGQAQQLLEKLT
jgi:pilus assembly protein FimV